MKKSKSQWLRVSQAAMSMPISVTTLYRMARAGDPNFTKIGNGVFVKRDWVDAFRTQNV